MVDDFQRLPVGERPRWIPIFPRGLVHFRQWRTARWFLPLQLPILLSGTAVVIRGRGLGEAAILLLLGSAVAAVLFVEVCSGMISSNHGTYFRRQEPIRYWLNIGVIGLAYVVLSTAGYFA